MALFNVSRFNKVRFAGHDALLPPPPVYFGTADLTARVTVTSGGAFFVPMYAANSALEKAVLLNADGTNIVPLFQGDAGLLVGHPVFGSAGIFEVPRYRGSVIALTHPAITASGVFTVPPRMSRRTVYISSGIMQKVINIKDVVKYNKIITGGVPLTVALVGGGQCQMNQTF